MITYPDTSHLSITLSDVKRLLKQLLRSSRVFSTIMFTKFPIKPRQPKTENQQIL